MPGCLPAHKAVHALTVINIFQMSLNLYMLFIFDIEWIILKMICIGLSVLLQRYTKVFRRISAYWGGVKFVKLIVTHLYCTNYNEIKYFFQLYKSIFRILDHTKNFWYIMGYTWKQLDMYFKFRFMVCFHHTKF